MSSKVMLFLTIILTITSSTLSKVGGKELAHFISLPIIDGCGIYTSVKMLGTESANNKAAAISNLSLLAINGGLGMMTKFSSDKNYGKIRKIHRIAGFAVTGASIWMAVSAGLSDSMKKTDKGIAAGYSVLTVFPLVLFSF
jgi:hypothetical protein